MKGGAAFSYGHIHYILTNPVYAGRIRHHAEVFPGLHPPLITPEVWDGIQEQLKSDSTKGRTFSRRNRNGAKPSVSRLAGKIFDQTGDRLTPSHTKTSKGRRLRYYVSHRLIRGTAPRDPSGWRLRAPELEEKVAGLIRQHMSSAEFRGSVLCDATTEETAALGLNISSLDDPEPGRSDTVQDAHLALADRIDISPGEIRVSISSEYLSNLLNLDQTRVAEDLLEITSTFQHRKRGVETKLIIGDEPADIDETLLRNIGRAHQYFDLVCSGKTLGEIAETEGVTKRRIQQLIELAFLAPDVIRSVREGRQPVGLTSEWLMRHAFTPIWSEQREQFSAL